MSKLEELKAALEAATPGEWVSTGVVVAVPGDGGMDYLLQGRSDGVRNDPNIEFAALAHNMMPTLLEAADKLRIMETVFSKKDPDPLAAFAAIEQARHVLEELK